MTKGKPKKEWEAFSHTPIKPKEEKPLKEKIIDDPINWAIEERDEFWRKKIKETVKGFEIDISNPEMLSPATILFIKELIKAHFGRFG